VGGQIWIDTNSDGLHDPTESLYEAPVTVEILTPGPDEQFATPDDTIFVSTLTMFDETTQTWKWEARDIPVGTYVIRYQIPSGYQPTVKDTNQNRNDPIDSDINPSQITPTGLTVADTDPFLHTHTDPPTTWDLGLLIPQTITG